MNIKQTQRSVMRLWCFGFQHGDVTGNHGDADCRVIKLNAAGDLERRTVWWLCCDEGECIRKLWMVATSLSAGSSDSNDGDGQAIHGKRIVHRPDWGRMGTFDLRCASLRFGIDVAASSRPSGDEDTLAGNFAIPTICVTLQARMVDDSLAPTWNRGVANGNGRWWFRLRPGPSVWRRSDGVS